MSDKVVLYYIIFIFYINGVWITVLSRKKLENFACIKVKLMSSDGSGPKPGPSQRPVFFGRPGAQLLEKGPSPCRPGARLLGKGWKIQAFLLLYIIKFQGPSSPEAQHSRKGSSLGPAWARLFKSRARPWLVFSGLDPSLLMSSGSKTLIISLNYHITRCFQILFYVESGSSIALAPVGSF